MTYAADIHTFRVNGLHLLMYRIGVIDDICGDDQTLHLTDYHVPTRPVGLTVMMMYTHGTSNFDLVNGPMLK